MDHFRGKSKAPVESVRILRDILLRQYSDTILNYPNTPESALSKVVSELNGLLQQRAFQVILDTLLKLPKNHSNHALQIIAWSYWPFDNFLPSAEDTIFIQKLLKVLQQDSKEEDANTNFIAVVKQFSNCVVPLASYLVTPETLDLATLNHFNKLFAKPCIAEQLFGIAQLDNPKFAPYFLQYHYRSLPESHLLSFKDQLRWKAPPPISTPKEIIFDVSSGVNEIYLKLNLDALYYISTCPAVHAETKFCVQNVLWAWFSAMGATEEILLSWIGEALEVKFSVIQFTYCKQGRNQ